MRLTLIREVIQNDNENVTQEKKHDSAIDNNLPDSLEFHQHCSDDGFHIIGSESSNFNLRISESVYIETMDLIFFFPLQLSLLQLYTFCLTRLPGMISCCYLYQSFTYFLIS